MSRAAQRVKHHVKRLKASPWVQRYRADRTFRRTVSLYQGMALNGLNALFRMILGLWCASHWLLSMAAYHGVLGAMRAYLIFSRKRQRPEQPCYRRIAWLLMLLNCPMGGMIVLMVYTDAAYSYPGTLIYLSALEAFVALGMAISGLIRFRREESPIFSAARVLNFVSAMMSILGLQTALIGRFSEQGEGYRQLMNALTGAGVEVCVIACAVLMLRRSACWRRETHESIRKQIL